MINQLIQLHKDFFFFLYNFTQHSDIIARWVLFIARDLDWYIVIVTALFLLLHHHGLRKNTPHIIARRSLAESVYVLMSVLIAAFMSSLLKIIFAVPRPFLQFEDITPLFMYGGYNSFPSGHAAFFAALAMAVFFYHKKVGSFLFFCACVISIARVMAGIHFPVDIVFGWLLGILISCCFYHKVVPRLERVFTLKKAQKDIK